MNKYSLQDFSGLTLEELREKLIREIKLRLVCRPNSYDTDFLNEKGKCTAIFFDESGDEAILFAYDSGEIAIIRSVYEGNEFFHGEADILLDSPKALGCAFSKEISQLYFNLKREENDRYFQQAKAKKEESDRKLYEELKARFG